MFTNISKYTIWDLTAEMVKVKDRDTQQFLYEGSRRGQTERFMIVVGDLIKEMFDKIELGFSSRNPAYAPYNVLEYLQKEFFGDYVALSESAEKLVRNFLEEAPWAWRLKGTAPFLHWILWKVFGWELLYLISFKSMVIRLNNRMGYIYDSDKDEIDQKILYDNESMYPEGRTTLAIDVFFDPSFDSKRELLLRLINEWTYASDFSFVNTP